MQAAKKERDLAAEKAKEASLLLKEEKKKRLQLEDKITQRLCRGGGYRLEERDAGIIPDGVVAYELEVAEEEAQIEKDRVCYLSKKLQEERQEKKAVIREARAERANLLLDLTVSKSLQSQFQKVAKRKVYSSEKKAKDASEKLVETVALFSERLQEERKEKRIISKEALQERAALVQEVERAKLQQKELVTLGRRATRQVDGLKIKEKKALEKLTVN